MFNSSFAAAAADSTNFSSSCSSAYDVDSKKMKSLFCRLLMSFLPFLNTQQKPFNAFVIGCSVRILNGDRRYITALSVLFLDL